jgi:hypothetical protein
MSLVNINKQTTAPDANDVVIEGNSSNTLSLAGKPNGLPGLFADLETNPCLHFISDGHWSMYDLLLHAVESCDTPSDVYITTYSMTELSARVIAKLKDSGKIKTLHLLMDYKSKMRYPQVDQLIRNVATSIGLTHLHAKVLVVMSGTKSITVIGSANWTHNPRVETGVIDTSIYIALSHVNWITQKITESNA